MSQLGTFLNTGLLSNLLKGADVSIPQSRPKFLNTFQTHLLNLAQDDNVANVKKQKLEQRQATPPVELRQTTTPSVELDYSSESPQVQPVYETISPPPSAPPEHVKIFKPQNFELRVKGNHAAFYICTAQMENGVDVFLKGYLQIHDYDVLHKHYADEKKRLTEDFKKGWYNNNHRLCAIDYILNILENLLSRSRIYDHETTVYKLVSEIPSLQQNVVMFKGLYEEKKASTILSKNIQSDVENFYCLALSDIWLKDKTLNTKGMNHKKLTEDLKVFLEILFKTSIFRAMVTERVKNPNSTLKKILFKNESDADFKTRNKNPWTLAEYLTYIKIITKPDLLPKKEIQTVVFQLLNIIRELGKNKIQHNDLHASNIFVDVFNNSKVFNQNDQKYFFRVEKDMPRLLIYDWDLSYSEESKNDEVLDKNKWHCKEYGVCSGMNPKLDSFRFVYKILRELFDYYIQRNKSTDEGVIEYLNELQSAFFIERERGFYTTGQINQHIEHLQTYLYHPCNNLVKTRQNGVRTCAPFAPDEPKILKNISNVLEDIIKIQLP